MGDRVIGRVPGVLEATVGDQRVLLAPTTLKYFTLNGSGSAIWEAIPEDGIALEGLVTAMCQAYGVDEADCRPDIEEFLTRTDELGVTMEHLADSGPGIEPSPPMGTSPSP